jgi:phosphatidylglycerophosphatase A
LYLLVGFVYGVWVAVDTAVVAKAITNPFYVFITNAVYWIGLFFAPFNLVDELKIVGLSHLNQKSKKKINS